jgi:hypothetical protein
MDTSSGAGVEAGDALIERHIHLAAVAAHPPIQHERLDAAPS